MSAAQISETGIGPPHKAAVAEAMLLDYRQRLTRLLFVAAEVVQPVATINDLPAPVGILNRGAAWIETNTILTAHIA